MFAQFNIGESVRVIRNVRNDGTYAGLETGELLVKRGRVGFVQNVGTFLQDQIIYSVHFLDENRIIGCREEELIGEKEAWAPSRFEFRDKVTTNKILMVNGKEMAKPGDVAEVLKVISGTGDESGESHYHIRFPGHTLQVSESMLEAVIQTGT
ncbi:NifZ protein [hydrothermal vent metagenome]|uniref:NifZ protein n=1 Tax=hydrothermal vent metagenome TaxID=652676 RepID=A0A3B1B751_9ZZZZ